MAKLKQKRKVRVRSVLPTHLDRPAPVEKSTLSPAGLARIEILGDSISSQLVDAQRTLQQFGIAFERAVRDRELRAFVYTGRAWHIHGQPGGPDRFAEVESLMLTHGDFFGEELTRQLAQSESSEEDKEIMALPRAMRKDHRQRSSPHAAMLADNQRFSTRRQRR